jgi:hypothetical protein
LKTNLRVSLVAALGLTCVLLGTVPRAQAAGVYVNPYGAFVSGSVLSNINYTQEQQQYSNGDIYGSGPLTLNAVGSASLAGAYASSSAGVTANTLNLTAQNDAPAGGAVLGGIASASGTIWDTVSFSGATAGEIGTFIFTGNSSSNSIFGSGNGTVQAYNASSGHVLDFVATSSFSIPANTQSQITIDMSIPLNMYLQIIETATVSSSASQNGYYSTNVSLDPTWSFLLPAGVSVTSASGTVYATSPVPVPNCSIPFLLSVGLLVFVGFRKANSRHSELVCGLAR